MKKMLIKLTFATINIFILGLGDALTGRLQKGIYLQLAAAVSFALGGYGGIFSTFTGMLFIYALILGVYTFAFFSFICQKTGDFIYWRKNIFIFLIAVILIKLTLVVPVRVYFFEPYHYEESYIMTDKRNAPNPQPLYIFWNKDFSKIGKSITN